MKRLFSQTLLSQRVGVSPATNLAELQGTEYLGRMIIAGINTVGNLVLCYGLTGRSANSKNRRILHDQSERRLHTQFADASVGGDPALVIYDVAKWSQGELLYTMSNGVQTTAVHDVCLKCGTTSFIGGLQEFYHEPDKPNFTPRITAQIDLSIEGPYFQFASLQRTSSMFEGHDKRFWSFGGVTAGFGMCITTYDANASDGEPIPAFRGVPFIVPLTGDLESIANTYWSVLNEQYRVAVAAIEIDKDAGTVENVKIINLHGDGE